jgi:hypothetical protein
MSSNLILQKYNKCPKEIINNNNIINCSEVFLKKSFSNFFRSHFPEMKKGSIITYFISIIHIMSFIYAIVGIFMNPKYLLLYSVYMTLLLTSLLYHKNNCFLTLLKKYFSGTNLYPLHLKEITTISILYILIIYSLISYIYPIISPYNLANIILNLIYNYSKFFSNMAIIILVFMILFYILLNVYISIKMKYGYSKKNYS